MDSCPHIQRDVCVQCRRLNQLKLALNQIIEQSHRDDLWLSDIIDIMRKIAEQALINVRP